LSPLKIFPHKELFVYFFQTKRRKYTTMLDGRLKRHLFLLLACLILATIVLIVPWFLLSINSNLCQRFFSVGLFKMTFKYDPRLITDQCESAPIYNETFWGYQLEQGVSSGDAPMFAMASFWKEYRQDRTLVFRPTDVQAAIVFGIFQFIFILATLIIGFTFHKEFVPTDAKWNKFFLVAYGSSICSAISCMALMGAVCKDMGYQWKIEWENENGYQTYAESGSVFVEVGIIFQGILTLFLTLGWIHIYRWWEPKLVESESPNTTTASV